MRVNLNDPAVLELAEAVQDGLPEAELIELGKRLFPGDAGMNMLRTLREEEDAMRSAWAMRRRPLPVRPVVRGERTRLYGLAAALASAAALLLVLAMNGRTPKLSDAGGPDAGHAMQDQPGLTVLALEDLFQQELLLHLSGLARGNRDFHEAARQAFLRRLVEDAGLSPEVIAGGDLRWSNSTTGAALECRLAPHEQDRLHATLDRIRRQNDMLYSVEIRHLEWPRDATASFTDAGVDANLVKTGMQLLESDKVAGWMEQARADTRFRIINVPRLMAFGNQVASIQIADSIAFVDHYASRLVDGAVVVDPVVAQMPIGEIYLCKVLSPAEGSLRIELFHARQAPFNKLEFDTLTVGERQLQVDRSPAVPVGMHYEAMVADGKSLLVLLPEREPGTNMLEAMLVTVIAVEPRSLQAEGIEQGAEQEALEAEARARQTELDAMEKARSEKNGQGKQNR